MRREEPELLLVVGTEIQGEGVYYCECGEEGVAFDPVEGEVVCGPCKEARDEFDAEFARLEAGEVESIGLAVTVEEEE